MSLYVDNLARIYANNLCIATHMNTFFPHLAIKTTVTTLISDTWCSWYGLSIYNSVISSFYDKFSCDNFENVLVH